jgi:hypothetical protein
MRPLQVGKNEIISVAYIKFSEIREGKFALPKWINLYGSPYPEETRNIVEMNSGFTEGSAYRGRILLSCDSNSTKDAKLGKQAISPPADPLNVEWTAYLDLYEGTQLDANDQGVVVELSFGPRLTQSKKISQGKKESRAVWYENMSPLQLGMPTDVTQVPDMYEICY